MYSLQSELPRELSVQENPSGLYLDPVLTSTVHTTGVIVCAKKHVWFFTSPYCSSTLLFSLSLEYSMYVWAAKFIPQSQNQHFVSNLLILQYLPCNVLLKVFIFLFNSQNIFSLGNLNQGKRKNCWTNSVLPNIKLVFKMLI